MLIEKAIANIKKYSGFRAKTAPDDAFSSDGAFFNTFVMRCIHYSIFHVKEILGDKSRMDAYAFALQIKARFTSSALKDKNTTYKHLKKLFNMGDIKLKRCLSDAEKYGYIRREGGLIIANKLYTEFDLVDTLEIDEKNFIRHSEILKKFRRSIFLNKIKIVQYASDTEKNNEVGRIGKGSIARARYHTYGGLAVCGSETNYAGFYFGYDKIAEMMGVSIRTAKRDVKDLREKEVIRRRLRFVQYLDAEQSSKISRTERKQIIKHAIANGKYLCWCDGIIWERQTNSYALTNPKNIKISYKYAKMVKDGGCKGVGCEELVGEQATLDGY